MRLFVHGNNERMITKEKRKKERPRDRTKAGYFKAIKTAKNKHWSSFLQSATPQTLWTAKKLGYGRTPSPLRVPW